MSRDRARASRTIGAAEGRRLLAEGTLELQGADGEEAVLRALPLVVTRVFPVEHAMVLPVADDDRYHRSDATEGANLVIPLRRHGGVFAVLSVQLRRDHRFVADDRAALEALARIAERSLHRIFTLQALARQHHAAGLIAGLAERLAPVSDSRRAAAMTLQTLLGALDVEAGSVLQIERGAFRPLAMSDRMPAPLRAAIQTGIPLANGYMRRDWLRGEPVFEEDYAAAGEEATIRSLGLRAHASIPVRDDGEEPLALIVLGSFNASRVWSDAERDLALRLASTYGAALARIIVSERQAELLDVVRLLAHARESRKLYQRLVEAAVRVVPGADAGSLVVRADDGTFVFEGAVGYDLEAIRRATMTETGVLAWYGRGELAWRAGSPRVLVGAEVQASSMASAEGVSKDVFVEDGRVPALRASLCVPIAYQGLVLAALNVDSFSREDAFGPRSVEVAQALGHHVAAVVRRAQDLAALERSALTDSLTGVGNRVAFNQTLEHALRRAGRYGERIGVAILDVDGFKRVNDTLGHLVGDRVLVAVAAALGATVRASDAVFRWGGDEFAVIMPHLEPLAASATIGRLVAAVEAVDEWDIRLGASVGLAFFPDDGVDHEALLRCADERMYRDKDGGAARR